MDISDFGRDHWSALLYAETCIVDNPASAQNSGNLEPIRMRCNKATHPQFARHEWNPKHGTRLSGWKKSSDERILPEHDDWDCLQDMEDQGFLKVVGTMILFTDLGIEIASQLRKYRAKHKGTTKFVPKLPDPEQYDNLSTHPNVRKWQEVNLALLGLWERQFSEGEKRQIRKVIYDGIDEKVEKRLKELEKLDKSSWNMITQHAATVHGDTPTVLTMLDFIATTIEDFEKVA